MIVCPDCGKLISARFPVHACRKVRFACPDCGEARVEEVYIVPERTSELCNKCAGSRTLKRLNNK